MTFLEFFILFLVLFIIDRAVFYFSGIYYAKRCHYECENCKNFACNKYYCEKKRKKEK